MTPAQKKVFFTHLLQESTWRIPAVEGVPPSALLKELKIGDVKTMRFCPAPEYPGDLIECEGMIAAIAIDDGGELVVHMTKPGERVHV